MSAIRSKVAGSVPQSITKRVLPSYITRKPVELKYEDICSGSLDLSESIKQAYGPDGLGLLTVSGVPGMTQKRLELLPLAAQFANLPDEVKAAYEHKESYYSFGWSHGKEKLQGRPDFAKGSFYANPQYDRPFDDEQLIKKYSSFTHPNIWPDKHLPQLEGAFKAMGSLIVEVGMLVAAHCDTYVKSQCPSYSTKRLHNIIKNSKCCKARLLHYFPISADDGSSSHDDDHTDFSDWCGWHNDHGSLTGLVPALYMDKDQKLIPNPDPASGLFIRSRQGELVKVDMPSDHLAFQIGETAQIHSGGVLQATPHAVKGSSFPGVSRETFAVFMEPCWMEDMDIPKGRTVEEAQSQLAAKNLPPGIPPLAKRWQVGQTFGDFSEKTITSYY